MRSSLLPCLGCALALAVAACASSRPPAGGAPEAGVVAGDPALPIPPTIPSATCAVTLGAGIWSDGTHPEETTDGLEAAIASLVAGGCGHVRLPAGDYAVGKQVASDFTVGLELPSGVSLELDPGAVLRLRPTATPNYCVVNVSGKHDVRVSGGAIVGDRATHDFTVPGEEGHCVCVSFESRRVEIVATKLSEAIGDGVLIVAQGAAGSSCTDVSITDAEIFETRRQGVSVVGGVRVRIERNHIHHVHGVAPQFGVDIESRGFTSRDVTIRGNRFDHDAGGDVVNVDGRAVLIADNTMTDGDGSTYVDGPIVYKSDTDQIIRGNRVSMSRASANGRIGIIEYSTKKPRTDPARNLIEANELEGCSIALMYDARVTVRGNRVRWSDASIMLDGLADVQLLGNVIERDGADGYRLHACTGAASGNTLNGAPIELPLTSDAPYSNWEGN